MTLAANRFFGHDPAERLYCVVAETRRPLHRCRLRCENCGHRQPAAFGRLAKAQRHLIRHGVRQVHEDSVLRTQYLTVHLVALAGVLFVSALLIMALR
jgi:hypothetical protein